MLCITHEFYNTTPPPLPPQKKSQRPVNDYIRLLFISANGGDGKESAEHWKNLYTI